MAILHHAHCFDSKVYNGLQRSTLSVPLTSVTSYPTTLPLSSHWLLPLGLFCCYSQAIGIILLHGPCVVFTVFLFKNVLTLEVHMVYLFTSFMSLLKCFWGLSTPSWFFLLYFSPSSSILERGWSMQPSLLGSPVHIWIRSSATKEKDNKRYWGPTSSLWTSATIPQQRSEINSPRINQHLFSWVGIWVFVILFCCFL